MPQIPHYVKVRQHPGSSREDIENEPSWNNGHQHRIGYRNRQDRIPGVTHSGDEKLEDVAFKREALKELDQLQERVSKGDLINFRDAIKQQEDFHLRRPDVHPGGWRYVLNTSEDWIKNTEEWPANVKKRKVEEEAKRKEEDNSSRQESEPKQEHEWRHEVGEDKHHDAYPAGSEEGQRQNSGQEAKGEGKEKSEYEKFREKYSPQEIALLRSLQHEKGYVYNLEQNDGKGKSPLVSAKQLESIDEADQFSPDNWIARSEDLIRLTGKHP
ncbi:hypothetical protein MMC30_002516 [Trapelia coarctata]|nr:hypothetical protein [Trapelia coarctata]